MDRDTFFKQFDLLADQPDAVAKMRCLVIKLAVTGRLTADIKSADSLPPGWMWQPLSDVVDVLDHLRVPINNAEREMRITGKPQRELYPYYGATQQAGWIDDFIFHEELVLLGEDGVAFDEPERPKSYVISGKSWVNNHAHVLRGTKVMNQFLAHYLNVFDYSGRITGTTRMKLNQAKMLTIPVPTPPLAEQRRIVAKVKELMALCDELEQRQQARRDTRQRLTHAAFHHLTAAKDPTEFRKYSSVVTRHSSLLFDDVPQLRQAILQLAVQGRLVTWERTTNGNKGIKFEDIIQNSRYGTAKKCDYRSGGTPVLRIPNIIGGKIDLNNLKRTELTTSELRDLSLEEGGLLIVRSNGRVL